MSDFAKMFRMNEYWSHIFTPILLFLYISWFNATRAVNYLEEFVILLSLSIFTAVGGYLINDFSDVEDDKKVGKQNFLLNKPIFFFPLSLLLCIVSLGFVSLYCYKQIPTKAVTILMLLIFNFILFIVYSLPPFRLKRFHHLAIALDATYSGTIFYLMAFLIPVEHWQYHTYISIFLIFLFGLLRGGRNYAYHAVHDEVNDRLVGVENLSFIIGAKRLLRIVNLFYPFEMACIVGIILLNNIPITIFVLALFLFFCFFVLWWRNQNGKVIFTYNDLYDTWLPFLLVTGLVLYKKAPYEILILHVLLFPMLLLKIKNDILVETYRFFKRLKH